MLLNLPYLTNNFYFLFLSGWLCSLNGENRLSREGLRLDHNQSGERLFPIMLDSHNSEPKSKSGFRRTSLGKYDDSFVICEGPNKTVQCLLSPPPRDKKSQLDELITDAGELPITERTDNVTLKTIEKFLKLDTTLKSKAIQEILQFVQDPTMSNLQVVKRLRPYFLEKIYLWHGLSIYIVKTLDPLSREKQKRKSSWASDGTSKMSTSSNSSSRSPRQSLLKTKGKNAPSKKDKSENSSYRPGPEDGMDRNVSRQVEGPDDPSNSVKEAPNAARSDPEGTAAGRQNASEVDEESVISSEIMRLVAETAPTIIAVDESRESLLEKKSSLSNQVQSKESLSDENAFLTAQDNKDKGKTRSFLNVVNRIMRGVTVIRDMVRHAGLLRKSFVTMASSVASWSSGRRSAFGLRGPEFESCFRQVDV
ncbi:hypothetical protein ElyMa_000721400 [Elysia marginata]|uniref:Uncharacterized protein n=1 Tax=Elysia marginata TaxID=1093978 RepID=A0AAV4GLP5_9GAST|nr:hypothetical protein ElyMa_000721400 [Elysia marginata]